MSRDSNASRSSLAPSASSTSAEPHFEVKLRLPCLTTGSPQAAATNPAAVETLIEPEKSPPVPQLSANRVAGAGKAQLAGIAVVAHHTLLVEPEAVIASADRAGLFVVGEGA